MALGTGAVVVMGAFEVGARELCVTGARLGVLALGRGDIVVFGSAEVRARVVCVDDIVLVISSQSVIRSNVKLRRIEQS